MARALNVNLTQRAGWKRVLVPPTHVVGGPPGLELEVPLQPGAQVLLEVLGQALHPGILLIIHEGPGGLQVLKETNVMWSVPGTPAPSDNNLTFNHYWTTTVCKHPGLICNHGHNIIYWLRHIVPS